MSDNVGVFLVTPVIESGYARLQQPLPRHHLGLVPDLGFK